MNDLYLAVAAAISLLVGAAVTLLVRSHAGMLGLLDEPNSRSSHENCTPRGGGLGIAAGAAAGLVVAHYSGHPLPHQVILLAASAMALVGLTDDRLSPRGLPAFTRLLLQVAAAVYVVWNLGGITELPLPSPLNLPLGALAGAAGVIWLVAVTNIYNFQDGINGYAGLQGLVAAVALALVVPKTGIATMGLVLAASCAGFLIFNWNRASIFMGDVGSYGVGFLLAALPFHVTSEERSSLLFVTAIALWFFLTDGAWTLVARALQRKEIFQGHREHHFQKLVDSGLCHWQVASVIQIAAAVLALIAVLSIRFQNRALAWIALGLAAAAFLGMHYWAGRTQKPDETMPLSRSVEAGAGP